MLRPKAEGAPGSEEGTWHAPMGSKSCRKRPWRIWPRLGDLPKRVGVWVAVLKVCLRNHVSDIVRLGLKGRTPRYSNLERWHRESVKGGE